MQVLSLAPMTAPKRSSAKAARPTPKFLSEINDVREIEFYEDLAWRLDEAVEMTGRKRGEVADSIGVSLSRLSNWTSLQNRPDWFAVARLCERYNISADWILLGDVASLKNQTLADDLAKAAEERRAARLVSPPRALKMRGESRDKASASPTITTRGRLKG